MYTKFSTTEVTNNSAFVRSNRGPAKSKQQSAKETITIDLLLAGVGRECPLMHSV